VLVSALYRAGRGLASDVLAEFVAAGYSLRPLYNDPNSIRNQRGR
jgi:hypothetical protein